MRIYLKRVYTEVLILLLFFEILLRDTYYTTRTHKYKNNKNYRKPSALGNR